MGNREFPDEQHTVLLWFTNGSSENWQQQAPGESLGLIIAPKNPGAEGQSRTDTGSPPPVFETGASTISPLRHSVIL